MASKLGRNLAWYFATPFADDQKVQGAVLGSLPRCGCILIRGAEASWGGGVFRGGMNVHCQEMAAQEVLHWLGLWSPVLKGSGCQKVLSKLERSLAVISPLGCGLVVLMRLLCIASATWRTWVLYTYLVFGFIYLLFLQFLGWERGRVLIWCFVYWMLLIIPTLNPSVVLYLEKMSLE